LNSLAIQPAARRSAARFGKLAAVVAMLLVVAPGAAQAVQSDGVVADPLPLPPRSARSDDRPALSVPPEATRTLAICVAVAGGIVLVVAVIRRLSPTLAPNTQLVRVLAQSSLAGRGTVFVVRCGPRVLILGSTPQHMTTLAEIADPVEIDEFTRLCGSEKSVAADESADAASASGVHGLKGQLSGLLNKIESWKA